MPIPRLRELGFATIPTVAVTGTREAWQATQQLLAMETPYLTDGVVGKVRDQKLRKKLGSTSTAPRWAFAYKVAGETAQAKVLGLTVQVGKSGTIGLVYNIEPTDLAGTTISRITAHNMSEVRRLDVMIGDVVTIRRAGDVIPFCAGVSDPAQRTGEEVRIETPTRCPACESLLQEFGNSGQLRCTGDDCVGTRARRLVHWASRLAADIDAIGPSWVEKFVEEGLLQTPADFYSLTGTQLVRFDNMGESRVNQFLTSIESSKQLGMRRALIGLSIPNASSGTAERLCRHFTSVEEVAQAELPRLASLEDIGVVVASSIVEFFDRPATKATLEELRSCGVVLDRLPEDAPLEISAASGTLAGKTVAITGKLTVDRGFFKRSLEQSGARVVGSVSSRCSILIVGDNVGTNKINSARKHGTAVMTEEEIRKMM